MRTERLIIAANISEPVLVLMAFSAALVSESIVTAVIAFAENTLGRTDRNGDESKVAGGG